MPAPPSSTLLTGLAFLRNPRQLGRSKTWLLDAEMYLGIDKDGNPEGITLLLRYFNHEKVFEFGEIGLYSLRAWVIDTFHRSTSYWLAVHLGLPDE